MQSLWYVGPSLWYVGPKFMVCMVCKTATSLIALITILRNTSLRSWVKLKRITMVTLKEKTLELEHNQGKYTFISQIPFNAFYVSSLYFSFHFRYIIFPKGPQWK